MPPSQGGASHVGFVFFPKSPRASAPEQAAALAERAGRRTSRWSGCSSNEDNALSTRCAQHGHLDTSSFTATKAAGVDSAARWAAKCGRQSRSKPAQILSAAARYRGAASHILYDAKPPKGVDLPGGTGMRFDWTLLEGFAHPLPWILAGGLDPANVREAIRHDRREILSMCRPASSARRASRMWTRSPHSLKRRARYEHTKLPPHPA